MDDVVLVERRGAVQVITINRPDARNALDAAVARGIVAAVDELDASDGLRVGVLTGAGGTFSAGTDLEPFLRGESRSRARPRSPSAVRRSGAAAEHREPVHDQPS